MSTPVKVIPVPVVDSFCAPLCRLKLPTLRTYGENSNGQVFKYEEQAMAQAVDPVRAKWWGILLHTTGSGILALAEKRGWTPDEAAVWTYSQTWMNCAHYLNLQDGTLVQIVSERLIAPHCGVKGWQYTAMKDGTWVDYTPPVMLAEWRKAWPNVKAPTSLYPHVGSANADVIGVENVPQPGGTFTDAQYATLRAFVAERDAFHGMQIATHKNRLLGHEDVNPFYTKDNGRADKAGGWDPGARRPVPKFDWARVWP